MPTLTVEQLHRLLEGIDIGVVQVGQSTQPVINLVRDALLDSFIVHGDETEVRVLTGG